MIAVGTAILLMLVLHLLTPFWWWIIVVPFGYGALISRSGLNAMALGAVSAGCLWLVAALYYWFTSADIITSRIAAMFMFNDSWIMVVMTAGVGIVAGGFAALSGYLLKSAIIRRRAADSYS